MAIRLVALAVGVHVTAIAQVLVDDPALAGGHRVQRDRSRVLHGLVGGQVGLALQRLLTPGTVALGIHHDAAAAGPAAEDDPLGQVLDRVDRLAVAADEQAEVLAVHRADERLVLDRHLDVGIEVQRAGDLLEQVAQRRLALLGRDGHQRRRPARFFLRRGGGGGALPARGLAASPFSDGAGSLRRFGFSAAGGGSAAPLPLPSPAIAAAAAGAAPPALAASRASTAAWPKRRRRIVCWPTVHRFVVIQYMIRPAGNEMMKGTKKNGRGMKMKRWLRSTVAGMRMLESSCEPT